MWGTKSSDVGLTYWGQTDTSTARLNCVLSVDVKPHNQSIYGNAAGFRDTAFV